LIRIVRVSDVKRFASEHVLGREPDLSAVRDILHEVKKRKDEAVLEYEERFGGKRPKEIRVSESDIKSAYDRVPSAIIDAITEVKDRLVRTESALLKRLADFEIEYDGIKISKKFLPIPSAGCYVPGGIARYPSSATMSVCTAKTAGVQRVAVATPTRNGLADPATVVAADICGADEIYNVGGAHAVAALAYGTESIAQVDKIVGPGGAYVAAAKAGVSGTVPIDMLAGPTELARLADDTTNPKYAAADMIAQAEHSKDALCFVVTESMDAAKRIRDAAYHIVRNAVRRDIIETSLDRNGFIAVCRSKEEAGLLVSEMAPEHLQIMTESGVAPGMIDTAGLVLVDSTPSTASDYLLGTNHILPTGRQGRSRGALSVLDFIKVQTIASANAAALGAISPHMKPITESEGLPNHYESVRCRL